ncbi:NCS2 family permease [Oceanobacillus timonensis]|uniref:NCS2 family permease n=1 Tax=Oceanobacillus timonensis TaxID=1926285 RepID=UPI0009BC113C|nr:NCS2 family permease [Oceanobacillus timonensis]
MKHLKQYYQLHEQGTSVKQEVTSGVTAFLAAVYIVAVNSTILADAGIPLEGAIISTVLASFIGCFIMGFYANAPIILMPAMGINAMFTFTFVHGTGMHWQEALAIVFIAGFLFVVIAFTKLADLLNRAIPEMMKHAVTAGIGFLLTFIGLEKGGLIEADPETFVQLSALSNPLPLATLLTFLIAMVLYVRNVPGHFLWAIICGVFIGKVLGVGTEQEMMNASLSEYSNVFFQMDFTNIWTVSFWTSVFAMTMVLTFENIGLISGYVSMLQRPDKTKRVLQASAISAMSSGVFGTSPTVATAETTAGISAGGKTGLSSLTTGVLFGLTLFALPLISHIPDNAIAPVLLIVGGIMMRSLANISFDSTLNWFPAYLTVAFIPLTHSIADGIAFGFVSYPLLHILAGKKKEVHKTMYVIGSLFLIHLILTAIAL